MFGKWSRRDIIKSSGAVAPVVLVAVPAAAQGLPVHAVNQTDNLYTRIGVRPILNARGTYTIISGSRSLPQVKQAMFEASHYYVHLDELMDGIGAELAKLTGASWGITTNGCAAAIVQATVACMVGTDVEKAQALPHIKAKDQVIIPKHSRNQYDIGVRMVGAEVVEVETADDLYLVFAGRGPERAANKGHLRNCQREKYSDLRRRGSGRAGQAQHPPSCGCDYGGLFRRQVPAGSAIFRYAAGAEGSMQGSLFQRLTPP